jgi:hypothetical protein
MIIHLRAEKSGGKKQDNDRKAEFPHMKTGAIITPERVKRYS